MMSNYGYKKKNQSRSYLNHLVSYFKIFCNVGLIMIFFGQKQVEQGTKAQRGSRGTDLLFI